ncbi:MAG: hypothetical protein ACOX9R_16000 [Armatimonadota bacterium]|jgi:hypothetical protein
MARRTRGMTVLSYLLSLAALCIAVGYVDAVATFYVRGMLQVAQEGGGFAQAVTEAMPPRIVALEQTRQAATVLVLVAVAIVAGRNLQQQFGTAFYALGGWIVFRYAAIRTITDWPGTLTDVDTVLYLPHAVYAPVWMPLVVGLGAAAIGVTLVRGGALALRRS